LNPTDRDPDLSDVLRHVVARHGSSVLDDAGRLRELLLVGRRGESPAVQLILKSLALGLPQHLLEGTADEPSEAAIARLAPWLGEAMPCPLAEAVWLVQTWRHGLGFDQRPSASLSPATQLVETSPPRPPSRHAAKGAVALPPHIAEAGVAPSRKRPSNLLLAAGGALVTFAMGGLYYALVHSSMQILQVQPRAALVSNGRPQEVLLQYTAHNAELKQIDVRLVRGPAGGPPNFSVPVAQGPHGAGEIPAGTLSSRSATPHQLTYEYQLVSRDGKRSAPFEKTFDLVPPSVITKVAGPGATRPGQPFTVALDYQRGSTDIVQVVSRVVESDAPWPTTEQIMPVTLNQASGRHELRLEPPAQARNSTLEFTMVDAAGISSEPVRLAVATAAVGGQPGTVQSVVRVGGASGLGAVAGAGVGGAIGNRFGRGNGRTAMTLLGAAGGAIVGHQVEQNVRGSDGWETSVRLDSGAIARIRHADAPRWQVGSRVRVVGNSIRL
jgi:outer membrane lipoprotein SlyB